MNQLGYYGKTVHRGDFVRFNLPQSFIKVWDDWLQQILIDAEQQHNDWSERYSNAPSYRFVLSSGIAGNEVWVGVLVPSTDKVGRRFPFCLAMSLPDNKLPCLSAVQQLPWFEEAETLLERVLASDYDFENLQGELTTMADNYAHLAEVPENVATAKAQATNDSITVSVESADALRIHTQSLALLDTVLEQTLGEYSVWMNCGAEPAMILNAGLPAANAGLALFVSDWELTSSVHLSAVTLEQHIGTAAVQPAALMGDEPTQRLSRSVVDNKIQVADQAAQAELNSSAQDEQLAEATTPSGDSEQVPTADDWAALDEYTETKESYTAVAVPEVEPLELDEDDLPEAPWER